VPFDEALVVSGRAFVLWYRLTMLDMTMKAPEVRGC
jgi:hypothetical protein